MLGACKTNGVLMAEAFAGTPNFGPTRVFLDTGSVTSDSIADGTIVAADIADGTITNAKIASTATIKQTTLTFRIDGNGFAITTGVKGPSIPMPFACTINSWKIIGDQSGSIVFDIWKAAFATGSIPTVANTITASAKPTLTTTFGATSSTLTGWTTSITAGDTLLINVDSITTLTQATLQLAVTLT